MKIMRALGLFKIYLYLLFLGSIVSLELLILLLGILLNNRSCFLSFSVGYRDLSPLYLPILSNVRSNS